MFNPLPHQIEKAQECYDVLKKKGLVYLAGEVRSGKTLTAVLTVEQAVSKNILILTKKAAFDGWNKFKDNMTKNYTITNYEQVNKLNKDDYDIIIVDEAHNLGCIGKMNKRVREIRELSYDKPVMLLSGTPHAETKASLYHQMCITKYSPFLKWGNFYRFFETFGVLTTKYIAGRVLKEYKKTKPELDIYIEDYFVTMTQQDAGIEQKSKDQIHYVELSEETKSKYNELLKEGITELNGEQVICDSDMKLRVTLHQLETGPEKVKYIRDNFKGKIAIMSHFIKEREYFEKELPYCDVYSSNRHAEGVDLSDYDHFIIVSGDYSGSKFIQRRERNVNINNEKTAVVHHLLVKGAISEQVYNQVSKKKDFNNKTFKKDKI